VVHEVTLSGDTGTIGMSYVKVNRTIDTSLGDRE
jgi:hypothetical protein